MPLDRYDLVLVRQRLDYLYLIEIHRIGDEDL